MKLTNAGEGHMGRLSDRELLDALNVAMGDIECNSQTRMLLTKIVEELVQRVIEQPKLLGGIK
jgi:hypothetical protein